MSANAIPVPYTPAVRRGIDAVGRLPGATYLNSARATLHALSAALDTECHESVAREWGGDEEPCNAPVVGYRTDEEGPYPVCADHMRDPMVPLTAAILGATS